MRLRFSDAELHKALNVALVVKGGITIPYQRHAFDALEQLQTLEAGGQPQEL